MPSASRSGAFARVVAWRGSLRALTQGRLGWGQGLVREAANSIPASEGIARVRGRLARQGALWGMRVMFGASA
jgi:hypothetical protein